MAKKLPEDEGALDDAEDMIGKTVEDVVKPCDDNIAIYFTDDTYIIISGDMGIEVLDPQELNIHEKAECGLITEEEREKRSEAARRNHQRNREKAERMKFDELFKKYGNKE